MNANTPDDKPQNTRTDLAAQEKIREFCYEIALALRRIKGRVNEKDPDLSVEEKSYPANILNEDSSEKKSSED